jgi:RNA-directed DNA polymerase
MENIPVRKDILKQWLKSGVLENGSMQDTETGVPQGGIISPIIANMVLDGLGNVVKKFRSKYDKLQGKNKVNTKMNYVRYADDFLITASERKYLELLLPEIESFLEVRGLTLNKKKTKIFNIREGFNFLGFNIRKYGVKNKESGEILLIK